MRLGNIIVLLMMSMMIINADSNDVTFPYRKLYILDNKLEFSGIKLAET